MTKPYSVKNERKSDYPVDNIFLKRWSPRSLSSNVSEKELMNLFEAARWTPSSSNGQPWRFIYAKNGSKNWETFYNFLGDFNKIWCKNAAYLIVLLSRKKFECDKNEHDDDCVEKEDINHSFGAGSAWMSLALQARINGLIAHAMAGFDVDKTRNVLKIPDSYFIDCMIAVGKEGEMESAIPERMQKSEKPNSRKKVSEFVSEGKFGDWD